MSRSDYLPKECLYCTLDVLFDLSTEYRCMAFSVMTPLPRALELYNSTVFSFFFLTIQYTIVTCVQSE